MLVWITVYGKLPIHKRRKFLWLFEKLEYRIFPPKLLECKNARNACNAQLTHFAMHHETPLFEMFLRWLELIQILTSQFSDFT